MASIPSKHDIENELGVDDGEPVSCKPVKLTPEVHKLIVDAVSSGAFFGDAAAYAGVTRQTLHNWMKRGRKQKRGKYKDLVKDIDKARADLKVGVVKEIVNQTKRDWKAGMTWLQKVDYDHYGDRAKIEVQQDFGNELHVVFDKNWKKKDIDEDDKPEPSKTE